MKKSTIWKSLFTLTLITFGYLGLNAQTLSVNSETLQRHGYDATSNPVTYENTDSVTTGSTMRYYVIPDATANPSYTGILTGTLSSSFWWSTANATSTAAGTIGQVGAYAYGNYRQVQWAGTGTIELRVNEKSTAGCSDTANVQIIPVRIIAAPTTEFTSANAAGRCISGTNGSLTETLTSIPIRFASSVGANRELVVTYNVAGPAGFTAVTGATANITETGAGAGTFNVATTLTHFGTYTVTITAINDRISTKSSVNGATGDVNTDATTQSTYQLVINRVPVTGPVYHIPNM